MTFFLVLFVLWLALLSSLWILLLWRRHIRIAKYADFDWGMTSGFHFALVSVILSANLWALGVSMGIGFGSAVGWKGAAVLIMAIFVGVTYLPMLWGAAPKEKNGRPSAQSNVSVEMDPHQPASDREIVNSRLFHQPREKVFNAFSNADLLAKWWGPKGFSNSFQAFDFRPGGEWTFTMHGPGGHDFKNESVFSEISRPAKLIIDHVSTPRYVLEIALTETDEGTLLTWRQRFETPAMRDKIANLSGKANEENLDRLGIILAGLDPLAE